MYAQARYLYRLLSPSARKERSLSRRFYTDLIEPGALCFDVGANVGQTTETLVECGARVICIEPNPKCFPVLDWQFARSSQVTLVRSALGSQPGRALLKVDGTASTASLREDWSYGSENAVEVEVVVTSLDALIAQYGRPQLCKVDVEGFETEVFQGLSQPIPVVDFEFHRDEIDRARQILARLSSIGEIVGANIADADHAGWLLDDWVTVKEFSDRLGGDLPEYANAVVKMAAPAR